MNLLKVSAFCVLFLGIGALYSATLTLDATQELGKVKMFNGGNGGPNLYNVGLNDNLEAFKKLRIPIVRLHDVPLFERGLQLVDTDMVFPLAHLDENDARNFYFKPTDDYIARCIAAGSKIFYRLGVSIDHSKSSYKTTPPDPEKWARICIKIIEHYNEGWANGFHYNIEYWEIWNEPEVKQPSGRCAMWDGTTDEFNEFYIKVSKIIKKRFPNIKIGGPAHTGVNKYTKPFLEACKKAGAPLDFYSWHGYRRSAEEFAAQPAKARKLLDEYGFTETELHYDEWHPYTPKTRFWGSKGADLERKIKSLKSTRTGVIAVKTMILFQDTPLTQAYFYTTNASGNWGVFDLNGSENEIYYPFEAFGSLTDYGTRVKCFSDEKSITAIAGKSKDGSLCVVVAALDAKAQTFNLKLENVSKISSAEVSICRKGSKLEPVEFDIANCSLQFDLPKGSSCSLIKIKQN